MIIKLIKKLFSKTVSKPNGEIKKLVFELTRESINNHRNLILNGETIPMFHISEQLLPETAKKLTVYFENPLIACKRLSRGSFSGDIWYDEKDHYVRLCEARVEEILGPNINRIWYTWE